MKEKLKTISFDDIGHEHENGDFAVQLYTSEDIGSSDVSELAMSIGGYEFDMDSAVILSEMMANYIADCIRHKNLRKNK